MHHIRVDFLNGYRQKLGIIHLVTTIKYTTILLSHSKHNKLNQEHAPCF